MLRKGSAEGLVAAQRRQEGIQWLGFKARQQKEVIYQLQEDEGAGGPHTLSQLVMTLHHGSDKSQKPREDSQYLLLCQCHLDSRKKKETLHISLHQTKDGFSLFV